MSAYSENKTSFKDVDTLIEALVACGYPKEAIEVHKTPQHLYGYHGDRRADTADIIIRRENVNRYMSGGASNDIGFKKSADGTYNAIISEYDSGKHNAQWMAKLKTSYAENGIMKTAGKQGLRFAGRKIVNGKVQLQFITA
jgi:hypothetical protein